MKIRMKTLAAGPAGPRQAGSIVDLPDAEAYQLIEGGYAEQVGAAAGEVETAEAGGAVETAEAPANKRKRGRAKKA